MPDQSKEYAPRFGQTETGHMDHLVLYAATGQPGRFWSRCGRLLMTAGGLAVHGRTCTRCLTGEHIHAH